MFSVVTKDGWWVTVHDLALAPTYSGLLEGRATSEEWIDRIRQEHQRRYFAVPLVLPPEKLTEDELDSEIRWLPRIMYTMRCEANRPVGEEGGYSRLDVIFFNSDIANSLLDIVAEHLAKVDWASKAEDVEP